MQAWKCLKRPGRQGGIGSIKGPDVRNGRGDRRELTGIVIDKEDGVLADPEVSGDLVEAFDLRSPAYGHG